MVQPSDTIIVSLDDVIVTAEIEVNTYMSEKGNPYLNKSHDINTYVYYSERVKKVGLTVMGQYRMNHNPVMDNYVATEDHIIKTFSNDGNIHYFSVIAAATYQLNKSISFSSDIRYNHTKVDAIQRMHNNDITGNFSMNLYSGHFSFSPYVNFNKKVLDISTLAINKQPIDYGMSCSYSIKDLLAEILVVSPFTKRKVHSILDTPYYAYNIQTQNRTESQYCNLKITYTFDFGRKTGKVKRSIDNEINSALLRVT